MKAKDSRLERAPRRRVTTIDALRRSNLSAVLGHVHRSGPLSRTELSSMTGLSRSTIADLVGELSALEVVEERPAASSSGPGRPSPIVSPRPESAALLAIELAVDSIAVATVGLGCHVYNRLRVKRPRHHLSPEQVLDAVADLTRPVLASLPPRHSFLGVGVGIVGITRRSDGFVHLAPNLRWRDIPLSEMLAARLDIHGPIRVSNEADLGALAEHRRGKYAGSSHLIYISGEVGIGAGVIVNGEPLLGAGSYAGEAGHTMVNPDGRPCLCGATGCWETEAGEAALLRHAGIETSATGLETFAHLSERAAAGDTAILSAAAEVGRWLGLGIGNLVNIFNPEVVLLGGLFHWFYPYLEESVVKSAGDQALPAPWAQTTIAPSTFGSDATLIGAAELLFSELIADPAGTPRTRVGG